MLDNNLNPVRWGKKTHFASVSYNRRAQLADWQEGHWWTLFCLRTHRSTRAASISTDNHTQARVKPCMSLIRWVAKCKPRGKPCHYVHMHSTVNVDAYLLLISIPHRVWLRGLKQSPVQQSHSAGRARHQLWPGWAFCGHDNWGWVHDKAGNIDNGAQQF